jgi:hypothetical protein
MKAHQHLSTSHRLSKVVKPGTVLALTHTLQCMWIRSLETPKHTQAIIHQHSLTQTHIQHWQARHRDRASNHRMWHSSRCHTQPTTAKTVGNGPYPGNANGPRHNTKQASGREADTDKLGCSSATGRKRATQQLHATRDKSGPMLGRAFGAAERQAEACPQLPATHVCCCITWQQSQVQN